MCRLLGIYGQVDGWRDLVAGFSRLAETGHLPPVEHITPGHQDGWGMTIANSKQTAMVPWVRQLGSAYQSAGFRQALESLPGQPNVLLCHLRKASDTIPISLPNAHPFVHNGWAFIHNGTIFQSESLPRDSDLVLTSDGSDSEHFFQYLLTGIRNRRPDQAVSAAIIEAVAALSRDFNAINFILSNGRDLYALRCFRQYETHFTLYSYQSAAGAAICSEAIDWGGFDQARWALLANRSLLKIQGTPPQIEVINF